MARLVGVESAGGRDGHGEALRAHEFGQRVEAALDPERAGAGHLLGEPLGRRADHPGGGARGGDAYGAVAVFHRGVRLGPRQGRLAHLQGGLVRETDGPAASQEAELAALHEAFGQRSLQRGARVGDRLLGVQAEVGAQERERRRREAGLDDGPLVGEVQDDHVVGGGDDRCVRVTDDGGRPDAALDRGQQLDDLGRRAGPGQRDEAVVGAPCRELRGRERVGLALPGLLAQRGEGLRHEPRGAAAHDRDALPRRGQLGGLARGQTRRARPALRLAVQLVLDMAHAVPTP